MFLELKEKAWHTAAAEACRRELQERNKTCRRWAGLPQAVHGVDATLRKGHVNAIDFLEERQIVFSLDAGSFKNGSLKNDTSVTLKKSVGGVRFGSDPRIH